MADVWVAVAPESGVWVLRLQTRGELWCEHAGRSAVVRPGDVCLLPPRTRAVPTDDGLTDHIAVAIPDRLLEELVPRSCSHSLELIPAGRGIPTLLGELLRIAAAGQPRPDAALLKAVCALLAVAMPSNEDTPRASAPEARTVEAEAPAPRTLRARTLDARRSETLRARVYAFVTERLTDPDLDVQLIAAGVGLSSRHLHRLFADAPVSLMQWVQHQRLDRCRAELLRAEPSRVKVSDVAYAWGFNDHAHFSRSFRKRFGVSPTALRRSSTLKQSDEHSRTSRSLS